MDNKAFNAIIARYLDKFEYTNGIGSEEWFKWVAAYNFQENWDIDARDFSAMLYEATKEFSVLIDNNHSMPISGIRELAKKETEFVRDEFRKLFIEDGGNLSDRQSRAEYFVDRINERVREHWSNTHLYLQSIRSAILLLSMYSPADNYILFWSRASEWAKRIEFGEDIGSGADFSLPTYYRMCNELLAEINKREELKVCAQKRLEAAKADIEKRAKLPVDVRVFDQYHLLVYDIIYCAYAYNLYVDIPTYNDVSTKKRLERAKERNELDQLQKSLKEAENALLAFEVDTLFPPDLIGHAVRSKVLGVGSICLQKEDRIKVLFDVGEKTFVFPDCFISKLLIPVVPSDDLNIDSYAAKEKERQRLTNNSNSIKREYESKKALFDEKWKRVIQNEMTKPEE